MPILDAKALKTDPDGMAFLRDVLGPPRSQPRFARQFLDAASKAALARVEKSAVSIGPTSSQAPRSRKSRPGRCAGNHHDDGRGISRKINQL